MSVKTNFFLVKLLMFFSTVSIFFGVYFEFSKNNILHPERDVTIIAGVDDNISVTPVAKDELNGAGSDVNGNDVLGKDSESFITPDFNINPNYNSNPGLGKNPLGEANTQLRKKIEESYGIKVKYGSETNGYSVGGMTTSVISLDEEAYSALSNLNYTLSLYPEGFFQEIAADGYPLTIYLLKKYSIANVTGVTDSTNNNIVISIATDYSFADTLHHEVYHYIEKYIFSKGFRFTSWSTLNPAEFVYGTVNSNFSYSRTYSDKAFFVNNYAQTDEYEDRASTFEYMMMTNKASCLSYGNTVWLKARTMSEQIDFFFDSVDSSTVEYWERHLLY